MNKFGSVLLKILQSIVVLPLAIIGAVLLAPFAVLCLLISLPRTALEDVWTFPDGENK